MSKDVEEAKEVEEVRATVAAILKLVENTTSGPAIGCTAIQISLLQVYFSQNVEDDPPLEPILEGLREMYEEMRASRTRVH